MTWNRLSSCLKHLHAYKTRILREILELYNTKWPFKNIYKVNMFSYYGDVFSHMIGCSTFVLKTMSYEKANNHFKDVKYPICYCDIYDMDSLRITDIFFLFCYVLFVTGHQRIRLIVTGPSSIYMFTK